MTPLLRRLLIVLVAALTKSVEGLVSFSKSSKFGSSTTQTATWTPATFSHRFYYPTSDHQTSDVLFQPPVMPSTTTSLSSSSVALNGEHARQQWVDKSLRYYSKVMREERRRNLGQIKEYEEYNYDFLQLAKKHYFALRKIKDGKPLHAELIYRRIIDELLQEGEEEDGECDHAKLAVTTLLLALHLQRTGDAKSTRSVFLSFFRIVVAEAAKEPDHECACSAKVLQAFALFEMKQGNEKKSLEIVLKAVKLDPTLKPVLKWKQFRDVLARQNR